MMGRKIRNWLLWFCGTKLWYCFFETENIVIDRMKFSEDGMSELLKQFFENYSFFLNLDLKRTNGR